MKPCNSRYIKMIFKKILIIILLSQPTIYTSGTKIIPSSHNENQHVHPTDTKKCMCFKNTGPNNDIIANAFPPGHEIETPINVMYRDVNDNQIIMYTPRLERQKLIPDLAYNDGYDLTPVSDEIINDIFLRSPHKTTERQNNIAPIESEGYIVENTDNDLGAPKEEIVLDTDEIDASGRAFKNDYKSSVPYNIHNIYDHQDIYGIPAISRLRSHKFTPAHHLTQQTRYHSLLHRHRGLDSPDHIIINNLKIRPRLYRNKLSLGDSEIRDGKIISSIKELPFVETVSFISPNSHGGQASPIDIILSENTKINHRKKNNPYVETTSASKLEPKSSKKEILESRDISAEDAKVIDKQNNEISVSVKPADDVSSVFFISLADIKQMSNRRNLRTYGDLLKRSNAFPKTDKSVELDLPVGKYALNAFAKQEQPFIKRRLGRLHSPDLISNIDTLSFRRGLRPDEYLSNRPDIYSNTNFPTDQATLDILNGVIAPRSARVTVSRDEGNYNTPNKRPRNFNHLDLSLNTHVPLREIPVTGNVQIPVKQVKLSSRDSIPVLDILGSAKFGNERVSVPDLGTFAINLMQSIFPKFGISRSGAKPIEQERLTDSGYTKVRPGLLLPKLQDFISGSGTDPDVPGVLDKDKDEEDNDFLVGNDDDDDDDGDGDFRIIGGNAATGSGTPLSYRGRSGRPY